jgi:hypothetical protein
MKTNIHFRSYLAQFFSEWKIVQMQVVEKHGTHVLFSITFPNRAVCEIMWKNVVQRGRPHLTIRRMRIACWIPKAANTQVMWYSLFLHCNSGCTNAPELYGVCTLPVCFVRSFEKYPKRILLYILQNNVFVSSYRFTSACLPLPDWSR